MPTGIYVRTKEHLEKMERYGFQKGHKSILGKKHTEESKKKMSKAHMGLVAWNKGIPFSEKTRRKMSEARKGKTPWNKGKKLPHMIGNTFRKGKIPWNKAKKFPQITGSKHPLWKGGTHIRKGYVYILKPKHPFTTKMGYVLRSRFVMEKNLERYLSPREVVHHINAIKDDDRIENLMLFPSNKEHMKFHGKPLP